MTDIHMSPKDFNVVLCALRLLQEELQRSPELFAVDMPLGDILTNGGDDPGPSIPEIDDLCQRFNCV